MTMPQSSKKKPTAAKKLSAPALATAVSALPVRAGMPAKDSIIGVTTFGVTSPAKAGAAFAPGAPLRIIHTNEVDEYETVKTTAMALAAATKKLPSGDNFAGTSRKVAKLSIATATTEKFTDVKSLIASLAPESQMKAHKPPLKDTATFDRVKEEKRNIRVKAFIYAASRENDNDFHLILGRDPSATPEMYMTMELSGLPPSTSASFKKLKAARDAFKKFFDDNFDGGVPGTSYDFYDPPIAVEIEGSLFFDVTHASGSRPGPKSLKSRMPVIWEVHPITKMTF